MRCGLQDGGEVAAPAPAGLLLLMCARSMRRSSGSGEASDVRPGVTRPLGPGTTTLLLQRSASGSASSDNNR
ncbi:hypothetical protein GQ55_9G413700 [Panicum hallii var. hallii]|uniref:Uncharacterized protein n=1 Tax=Panicum hallii var. hallii TaxID=1504633 RepID=A0A2T7CAP7_9POAL|nr:hypothetical protein GQ55_9G413700 [Panicum hallii var. hallii]